MKKETKVVREANKYEIFWVQVYSVSTLDRLQQALGVEMNGDFMMMVSIEKLIELSDGISCYNGADVDAKEIVEELDRIDKLYDDYVIIWK